MMIMPTTKPGRERIREYLKQNHIKLTDLALVYGMTRQEVSDYLTGNKTNPKANRFVLSVIKDYGIK
jgi:transcriptional regulator with XRE-family HTH domain